MTESVGETVEGWEPEASASSERDTAVVDVERDGGGRHEGTDTGVSAADTSGGESGGTSSGEAVTALERKLVVGTEGTGGAELVESVAVAWDEAQVAS